jgi:hypothetical protein
MPSPTRSMLLPTERRRDVSGHAAAPDLRVDAQALRHGFELIRSGPPQMPLVQFRDDPDCTLGELLPGSARARRLHAPATTSSCRPRTGTPTSTRRWKGGLRRPRTVARLKSGLRPHLETAARAGLAASTRRPRADSRTRLRARTTSPGQGHGLRYSGMGWPPPPASAGISFSSAGRPSSAAPSRRSSGGRSAWNRASTGGGGNVGEAEPGCPTSTPAPQRVQNCRSLKPRLLNRPRCSVPSSPGHPRPSRG